MAATKLWTAVFVLHAAFISLSGASETRCYWCGPLAEQVHRSRRSAPCGASDPITVCEPGYNYCAVVATSPPRVESRYCVKVYQDECYPLYCNSTKTWKMTCPCRGDLCNGPNTEREHEAFALLPKLVAKTHNARIKKRTPNTSPHLIKHEGTNRIISNDDAEIHNMSNVISNDMKSDTEDNKLIVTENYATSNIGENISQQTVNMHSDKSVDIIIEHHSADDAQSTVATADNKQASTVSNQLIEIEIYVSDPTEKSDTMKGGNQPCTEVPSTVESREADKHTNPIKDEASSIATTVESAVETETAKPTGNMISFESATIKPTEPVQQAAVETKSTDKPHTEPPKSSTEIMSENPMDQMQNDAPIRSPTDTAQTSELIEVAKPPTKDTVNANSGSPTAEALQQNGSPPVSAAPVLITEATKPSEPTTTAATTVPTILTTRESMAVQTTTPAPRRKNNSIRLTFSYMFIFIVGSVHL